MEYQVRVGSDGSPVMPVKIGTHPIFGIEHLEIVEG
jgi:hypothetical protein